MTLKDFNERLLQERYRFLQLCKEAGVFSAVAVISPKLAPAFAERLILDLDESQARARIRSDLSGAAAVAGLTAGLVAHRRNRPLLAAGMLTENLTPFYVLCALVLDAAHRDRNEVESPGHTEGLGDLPKC